MSLDPIGDDLLRIGFIYGHPFGKRVINHLINKAGYCTKCGPLCIHCRDNYHWFAGKIKFAYQITDLDEEPEEIFDLLDEEIPDLDLLIIIGIPCSMYENLPKFLNEHSIPAVIIPVEDPSWLSAQEQLLLQQELKANNIEFSFPRPFCSLSEDGLKKDGFIIKFINEFHVGRPILQAKVLGKRIVHFHIRRSAPCGATFYITQYLRNEQFNTWNTESLEEKVSTALTKFPCIAARQRDPVLQGITRVIADQIAHETIQEAIDNPEITE